LASIGKKYHPTQTLEMQTFSSLPHRGVFVNFVCQRIVGFSAFLVDSRLHHQLCEFSSKIIFFLVDDHLFTFSFFINLAGNKALMSSP